MLIKILLKVIHKIIGSSRDQMPTFYYEVIHYFSLGRKNDFIYLFRNSGENRPTVTFLFFASE